MTHPNEQSRNTGDKSIHLAPIDPGLVESIEVGWSPQRATFYARVTVHETPGIPVVDVPYSNQLIDKPRHVLDAVRAYARFGPGRDAGLLKLALPDLQNGFAAAYRHVQELYRAKVPMESERLGAMVAARIVAARTDGISQQARDFSTTSRNSELRELFGRFWSNIPEASRIIETALPKVLRSSGISDPHAEAEAADLARDIPPSQTLHP